MKKILIQCNGKRIGITENITELDVYYQTESGEIKAVNIMLRRGKGNALEVELWNCHIESNKPGQINLVGKSAEKLSA